MCIIIFNTCGPYSWWLQAHLSWVPVLKVLGHEVPASQHECDLNHSEPHAAGSSTNTHSGSTLEGRVGAGGMTECSTCPLWSGIDVLCVASI
jgi:hypothetical protein